MSLSIEIISSVKKQRCNCVNPRSISCVGELIISNPCKRWAHEDNQQDVISNEAKSADIFT